MGAFKVHVSFGKERDKLFLFQHEDHHHCGDFGIMPSYGISGSTNYL